MILQKHAGRRLQRELIPLDAKASFAFFEFRRPRYDFVWHYHPELELALVLKGDGLRFVGDSIQEFAEGDLVLLGANLPHTWHSTRKPKYQCYSMVIQFLPECLGAGFLQLPEARALLALFQRAHRGLVIRGKTKLAVTEMLISMTRQPIGSLQHLNAFISIMTLLAASRELSPLTVAGYQPLLSQAAHRRINQVLKAIQENGGEIPGQQELAASLRLSPQAFSRFFKRCIGKTFIQYVTELRIGRVCRELMETDASITAIAYGAGFNNLSNFNEQFRKLKRMTPSEYRRKVLVSAD